MRRRKKGRSLEPRIIGILGTQRGAGCTHLALCIANYLSSVEKRRVLYVEMGNSSALYPFVKEHGIMENGSIFYVCKGVHYLVSAQEKEAEKQICDFDGWVIVDLGADVEDRKGVWRLCTQRILLLGTQPWEQERTREFLEKNIKYDMTQMEYYSKRVTFQERNHLRRTYGISLWEFPWIKDPFHLERKNIIFLKQWLHR